MISTFGRLAWQLSRLTHHYEQIRRTSLPRAMIGPKKMGNLRESSTISPPDRLYLATSKASMHKKVPTPSVQGNQSARGSCLRSKCGAEMLCAADTNIEFRTRNKEIRSERTQQYDRHLGQQGVNIGVKKGATHCALPPLASSLASSAACGCSSIWHQQCRQQHSQQSLTARRIREKRAVLNMQRTEHTPQPENAGRRDEVNSLASAGAR